MRGGSMSLAGELSENDDEAPSMRGNTARAEDRPAGGAPASADGRHAPPALAGDEPSPEAPNSHLTAADKARLEGLIVERRS